MLSKLLGLLKSLTLRPTFGLVVCSPSEKTTLFVGTQLLIDHCIEMQKEFANLYAFKAKKHQPSDFTDDRFAFKSHVTDMEGVEVTLT